MTGKIDSGVMPAADSAQPRDVLRAPLDSIDRELAFYRSRSGQIYLVALSGEALIIVGREQIEMPPTLPPWTTPLVLTLLFISIAVVGTVLGAEYRRRIHELKAARTSLVQKYLGQALYPQERRVSEIQMLYFVLWFTSLGGSTISWIRSAPSAVGFQVAAMVFLAATAVAGVYGLYISFRSRRAA